MITSFLALLKDVVDAGAQVLSTFGCEVLLTKLPLGAGSSYIPVPYALVVALSDLENGSHDMAATKGEKMDTELLSEKVRIERKLFSFNLRENPRGRFLRVIEDVGGRRDAIVIPATGLKEVRDIIDRVIEADEKAGHCESNFD